MTEFIGSDEYLINIYNGYSLIYSEVSEFLTALYYTRKTVDLIKELGQDHLICELIVYRASIHVDSEDIMMDPKAYEYLLKFHANSYFKNSSKETLLGLASYCYLSGDKEKFLSQYRKLITKIERRQDWSNLSYTHTQMAKVYLYLG